MINLLRFIPKLFLYLFLNVAHAAELPAGIYDNRENGFKNMMLVIHKSGYGTFRGKFGNIDFDENNETINLHIKNTPKDIVTFGFKLDSEENTLTFIVPEESKLIRSSTVFYLTKKKLSIKEEAKIIEFPLIQKGMMLNARVKKFRKLIKESMSPEDIKEAELIYKKVTKNSGNISILQLASSNLLKDIFALTYIIKDSNTTLDKKTLDQLRMHRYQNTTTFEDALMLRNVSAEIKKIKCQSITSQSTRTQRGCAGV